MDLKVERGSLAYATASCYSLPYHLFCLGFAVSSAEKPAKPAKYNGTASLCALRSFAGSVKGTSFTLESLEWFLQSTTMLTKLQTTL